MELKNLKLILSWDGSSFYGYQKQPHVNTVQETIENCWKILTKEAMHPIGCSRLDAGVHAYSYVMNFQTQTDLTEYAIVKGMNGIFMQNLKVPIAVASASFVDMNFHSRFHTVGKWYRYLIWHGPTAHAALTKRCFHVKSPHSLDCLGDIMKQYEGEHHFGAFRASDCTARQCIKKIYHIDTWHHPHFPEMQVIDIYGDGFLKNMIRNMVGTAVDIATQKKPADTISKAFVHQNRQQVGVCAPGKGLSLMKVFYDAEEIEIAQKQAPRQIW